jgi:hypothetical protein
MNQFKLTRHSRLQGREAAEIGTTFESRRLSFQSHAEFCEVADAKELLKSFVFDFLLVQCT